MKKPGAAAKRGRYCKSTTKSPRALGGSGEVDNLRFALRLAQSPGGQAAVRARAA